MYSSNMKKLIALISILFIVSHTSFATEKPKIVAVIDTGFSFSSDTKGVKLCQYGHKDFSSQDIFERGYTQTPVPKDIHGHGTNIVGLITKYAGNANYCIVIIKFFDPKASGIVSLNNSVNSIRYAINIKADYINFSGGGSVSDLSEQLMVKAFLNRGGKFIAAAGNEKQNIDIYPYYPAAYDSRIVSVGSTDETGEKLPSSNYGSGVRKWEIGLDQVGFGIKMTGTSQATAITTGKIINKECAK